MLVGGDDGLDGQIELLGEFMVTCVVRWHRHHSSLSHTHASKRKTHTHTAHDTAYYLSVVHQHVVRNVNRERFLGDGVHGSHARQLHSCVDNTRWDTCEQPALDGGKTGEL